MIHFFVSLHVPDTSEQRQSGVPRAREGRGEHREVQVRRLEGTRAGGKLQM